ncbi:glycosyltransferase family protein [Paraburkholderia caballeronis]|uniref:hypothetical protein n=1 Tax=Paraburkholderia caballeronis TaxID=416943 RepID=UPI0015A541A4|nr:hypothetical protein [Paraburkholderia caballeronis]
MLNVLDNGVTPDSLKRVADAPTSHTVVVPYWHENRGHLVGFRASCRQALSQPGGDIGATEVVRALRSTGQVSTCYSMTKAFNSTLIPLRIWRARRPFLSCVAVQAEIKACASAIFQPLDARPFIVKQSPSADGRSLAAGCIS